MIKIIFTFISVWIAVAGLSYLWIKVMKPQTRLKAAGLILKSGVSSAIAFIILFFFVHLF